MIKFLQNNKTLAYIFGALLVLGLWKFSFKLGIFIGDNPKSMMLPFGFALFWILLTITLLYAYARLDEYQKNLVTTALALSALLTITIKMPLIFFEYKGITPSFNEAWMSICLIFSFQIFCVVLFLKDDDSAINHEN